MGSRSRDIIEKPDTVILQTCVSVRCDDAIKTTIGKGNGRGARGRGARGRGAWGRMRGRRNGTRTGRQKNGARIVSRGAGARTRVQRSGV